MLSILIPFYNLVLLPFSSFIISAVEIVRSLIHCRNKILSLRAEGKIVGFVPTMGALHDGHLALLEKALEESEFVVVSIFVNPTQFNNPDDFQKYPNSFDDDVEKLSAAGCHMVFAPDVNDMYPASPQVQVSFPKLQQAMEGSFRPGHFEGVALVVSKLLHLVPAQKAFFGQKDWQQFLIIKQLVKDLLFGTEIISVATVRESDGLAMSSRNLRLSSKERIEAIIFNKCLQKARRDLLNGVTVNEVKFGVAQAFEGLTNTTLEYFEIANRETLEPVNDVDTGTQVSLFIAGYVGQVRLIDNIFFQDGTE